MQRTISHKLTNLGDGFYTSQTLDFGISSPHQQSPRIGFLSDVSPGILGSVRLFTECRKIGRRGRPGHMKFMNLGFHILEALKSMSGWFWGIAK